MTAVMADLYGRICPSGTKSRQRSAKAPVLRRQCGRSYLPPRATACQATERSPRRLSLSLPYACLPAGTLYSRASIQFDPFTLVFL